MKVKYNDNGKMVVIGEIKDGVFEKKVNANMHLMEIYDNTPGIQSVIDNYLEDFDMIRIESDDGQVFESPKNFWIENRFKADHGHGDQYFMNKKKWEEAKGYINQTSIFDYV